MSSPTRRLIVEVLSDCTEAYDRGDKFAYYRSIPSLRAYLLLSQHQVGAELYLRQANGDWLLRSYDDRDDSVPLTALEVVIPLAEVYDKVELVPRAEDMGGPLLPLSRSSNPRLLLAAPAFAAFVPKDAEHRAASTGSMLQDRSNPS